ncbi:MAG: DNA repair protein RecO [Chloracidobacterium sp.]|nr:DNA repair protein RecO [Chloracidobacterium sp.]
MALIETESLVIKSYNLAEADRIVVFLTREQGMIRGVAKGAKRLQSKFGSALEPFSVVKLEYFQKDAVELVSIQKADLIQSHFAAVANPDFLQKFSYLGDILIAFSPPHDPNETLYRMVKASIETAAAGVDRLLSVGVYFELWLLRLSGYMPDWSKCDQCQRMFADSEETFLRGNYHPICLECAKSSGRSLSATSRVMALAARRISPSEFANFTADKSDDLRYLSILLKQMISQSLGREVVGEKSLAINK